MTIATSLQSADKGPSVIVGEELVATDMSPVNQLFNGRSVFITGASGFIGRVLLEKLLRCYQGIKRVYILMRPKRNMQPLDRLNNQLLKLPIFNQIKAMNNGQEILDKIVVITGDIGEPNLGIDESELRMMLEDESLGIIFHSAATVRFDEPLRTAIRFNLGAVEALVKLCKRLPNLVAFCHVSSAYVNSNIKNNQDINEQLYPTNYTPRQLLSLAETFDEQAMQQFKESLVSDWPNTYTYTKTLAEQLIATEATDLPVAIVRPSIVVAAWKEPLPGWIDNMNGPTGLLLAYGKGLMRTMYARRDAKADIVPVDIVINSLIAAAYNVAQTHKKVTDFSPEASLNLDSNDNDGQEPVEGKDQAERSSVTNIYHCTSGDLHPYTWGRLEKTMKSATRKYPSGQIIRHPGGHFKNNRWIDAFMRVLVHYLPALMIDLICLVSGRKQQLMSIYLKLHSAMDAVGHFAATNYNFKCKNIQALQKSLSHPEDRETLYMEIRQLDWEHFLNNYVLGVRRYVLKEDDQTLEQSRRSFKRAYYKELIVRLMLTMLTAYIFMAPTMRLAERVLLDA